MAARVTKTVRPGVFQVRDVKNLGWFFRKARQTVIDRFDLWQSNDGWEMFADFADGTRFHTHYADISVFKHVMGRQRSLRGVRVVIHPEDGSKQEAMLGGSKRVYKARPKAYRSR